MVVVELLLFVLAAVGMAFVFDGTKRLLSHYLDKE